MIYATLAPKGGFISPFGTTDCNVNPINAKVTDLLPQSFYQTDEPDFSDT